MFLESIKNSEEATALLSETAEYVENCHHQLGKFAARAFEIKRRELVAAFTRQHSGFLYFLAVALVAKHGATGYDADVAVLDFLCLNVGDTTAATNTTAALFLKHYRAERKLTSLPSPTMPTDNSGCSWERVRQEEARETTAASAAAAAAPAAAGGPPVEAGGDAEPAPAPTSPAIQAAPVAAPRKAATQPPRPPQPSGTAVATAISSPDKASGPPSLSQQQLQTSP